MKASSVWTIWTIPDQRHEMLYCETALAFTPAERAQNAMLRLAKQKEDGSSYETLFEA